jgi:hypothetical protein
LIILPDTGKRHDVSRLADAERLGGADRLAHVARRQMAVMLFDHAGVSMAEVAGNDHQRRAVRCCADAVAFEVSGPLSFNVISAVHPTCHVGRY